LTVSASGGYNSLSAAQPSEAEMLEAISRMQERAKANPNDTELWETLANAHAMMSRWPEALEAFQKTLELSPNKASVLSGYAEALAMTGDMVLAGEPMEYVILALKADPNDRKGLELAAIHAFQNQAFAESVLFLDRLLLQVSPQMPYAQDIRAMRQEAQRLADGGRPQALAPQSGTSADRLGAASAASISGVVDVAPEIRAQIRPESTLFLIARDGPSGPPLAAARVTMGDFPLPFRLDDRMVMNPGNTLSDHSEVVLLARITASGNPLAQTGDLEGRLLNVAVGADNVRIVIDQVVP
jgi:cytochrome c-type biogenesis protein CcmH